MFLNKHYVLANELTELLDIAIANVSVLAKKHEDEPTVVRKQASCTMLNSRSMALPKNIREGLAQGKLANKFTDLSDKLPCNYFGEEYQLSEAEGRRGGMITDRIKVGGKSFYVFDKDFVAKMKNKIGYVLNEEETMQCFKNKQIDGYIKVNKDKYFTWY